MDTARTTSYIAEFTGQVIGGWAVLDYVDAGKSAIVFKSTDGTNPCILKVFDRELVERFGEEAQAERVRRELTLIGKSHPNLVKIYGGGKCPKHNVYYIVMEYIDAAPLSDVLAQIPRQNIWTILGQIASATEFLEGLQLCHRDIKPSNIAVSSDFKSASLLDLGVLRPFGADAWKPVTDEDQVSFVGTLQYSSPEALFRKEEDSLEGWRALSFYQLGAVLHDLIMKSPIFQSFATPYPRLVEAVKSEIPIVQALDVVPELVLLAKNCLTKSPQVRLSLVKWEDFQPREPDVRASVDAKERMRRRKAQASQLSAQPNHFQKEQKQRIVQRALSSYQVKIEEFLREECIGNELFPLIAIQSEARPESNACMIHGRFPASPDHSLSVSLHLFLELALTDVDANVLRISYAAAQSEEKPAVREDCYRVLFAGVFEENVIRRAIQDDLYILFDMAQNDNFSNHSDEPRWIELKGGKADG
jgi:eukaryotic-like serine/threonine-protein kinase